MGRPVNKVETFPPEVKRKVDELLLENKSAPYIIKYLKTNYNISVSDETLYKYKSMLYKAYEVADKWEEDHAIQKVQLVANKKELLESLIADHYQRLQELRKINKRHFDPKWEGFITSYADNIRKIIETLSKFSEEFDNDTSKIENMVKRELAKVIRAVYETVKLVCPEKSAQFQQTFRSKYEQDTKREQQEEQKQIQAN